MVNSSLSSNSPPDPTQTVVDAFDAPLLPPLPHPYSDYQRKFYNTDAALVIDFGSSHCRAGWSTEAEPRVVFDSIVAKYRERASKGGVAGRGNIHAGSLCHSNITAKANIKTPFDTDVINTIEYAEYILDYAFLNLGIDSPSIDHRVVMTEPAGNPCYSRNSMTELLFECYQVPSLTYGVDSLFSFYENNGGSMDTDGLVFSSGHHTSHIIPIFGGRGRVDLASRISFGGIPAADFMLKSMQLKFPTFPVKMSFGQAQHLMHTQTFFADDYPRFLRRIGPDADIDYFNSIDVTVQFPYTELTAEEKSAEELERIAQRRREQGERLRQQVQQQRKEKILQREIELDNLRDLKASKSMTNKLNFLRLLMDYDLETEADLDAAILTAETSLRRTREKLLGIDQPEEKAPPVFDLIDIPDDELSDDTKREKRKQKLLKAGIDARERARLAKEAELAIKEEQARKDEEFRKSDFQGWLEALRAKHSALTEKQRARKRLREQLADRRSHASQLRMKSIANLAREERIPAKRAKIREDGDDDFGANDNDWAVYRQINKEEDSDEEEEAAQLAQYEALLLEHDEEFQSEISAESNGFKPTKSFLQRFQFGTHFPNWEAMENIKAQHQLHVNVERARVPEVLFQPSILGLDQASPQEILASLFSRVDEATHLRMIKVIPLGLQVNPLRTFCLPVGSLKFLVWLLAWRQRSRASAPRAPQSGSGQLPIHYSMPGRELPASLDIPKVSLTSRRSSLPVRSTRR
ncbi:Nuclear actin-protein involved in chromatin remodeling, variant 2 [Entomophthora muscae]|uniref:Nuclear actin-protein involved in chromatin remodeling, variant 2 n=1 Tax=Entomophthora muscae TaxID=34485 RepID=A0ACC2UPK1_9FUNG|nr:Nuclear actin-protein involved in chromatin remodeling, variant 2 [Entomophthora muscae]